MNENINLNLDDSEECINPQPREQPLQDPTRGCSCCNSDDSEDEPLKMARNDFAKYVGMTTSIVKSKSLSDFFVNMRETKL